MRFSTLRMAACDASAKERVANCSIAVRLNLDATLGVEVPARSLRPPRLSRPLNYRDPKTSSLDHFAQRLLVL